MHYRQTTLVHLADSDTLAIERDRTGMIGATVRVRLPGPSRRRWSMTPTLAPYRPLDATHKATGRRWLPITRAILHHDPFPGITERQRVDQALAATGRRS